MNHNGYSAEWILGWTEEPMSEDAHLEMAYEDQFESDWDITAEDLLDDDFCNWCGNVIDDCEC